MTTLRIKRYVVPKSVKLLIISSKASDLVEKIKN